MIHTLSVERVDLGVAYKTRLDKGEATKKNPYMRQTDFPVVLIDDEPLSEMGAERALTCCQ